MEQTPPTIGRALDEYEAALFVGRAEELRTFSSWLDDPTSPLLNVHGRGGIGKSTLLRAFRRTARANGRRALYVDLDGIAERPDAFWSALAPGSDDPLALAQEDRAVVLIDSYARSATLATLLQDELLTPLAADGKVVIAGRAPLGSNWRPWRALVRSMGLDVLSESEARRYLLRRGVTHRPLIDSILRTAAGLPLALSLAADIVLELGAVDLSSTTEWHLAVRTLVEHLMHEVADPELARLLEACAVVHHFDEPTLAAMTEADDVSDAFAR
ncbi:MAG TPA: ATP-binding protein, partial [Casimicrobiaceae bacterium]|nr:ATP-binding protein [Casimicrobiaceae bacterium]